MESPDQSALLPFRSTAGTDAGLLPIQAGDFANAEELIIRLYQPGPPQEINRIQNIIYKLQRSPQGWQYADAFLHSQHQNVRFYGALTFTTKMNHDWEPVSASDALLIQERLINWLIKLVNIEDALIVTRKLCVAVVAYCLRPSVVWNSCIRHLVICFIYGQAVPDSAEQAPTSELVSRLSRIQLRAVLWFMIGLVEEMGKLNISSVNMHKYHQKVYSNTDDAVALLQYAMNISLASQSMMTPSDMQEGMNAFHAWVMYAHRAWTDKALELEPLRSLTPLAIQSLDHPSMVNTSIEFFTEVLSSFPAFFTSAHFDMLAAVLTGEGAQAALSTLKNGDFEDDDTDAFARLLIAYGEAMIEDIAKGVERPSLALISWQLLELMRCKGHAEIEDTICSRALEFWLQYVEYLTDTLFAVGDDDPIPVWMEGARRRLNDVVEACWMKSCMPSYDEAVHHGPDALKDFRVFRTDVHEFLQSSYIHLGTNLLQRLTDLALRSLADHAWFQLEATLFLINSISDQVGEEDLVDQSLAALFHSSLYEDMSNPAELIPTQTRQTTMRTIAKYSKFFERNTVFLAPMLNFLFKSLKAPTLAITTSKAIFETCSSCRKHLLPELGVFLQQYDELCDVGSIDTSTKERVIGAIASIVQALPADQEKVGPLSLILRLVEKDVNDWAKFASASQIEKSVSSGVCALKCLYSLGKALQMPDDVVIDVDATTPTSSFWSAGPGASLQQFITNFLGRITSLMGENAEVMETSCQVLRVGYSELMPGLFVFPPVITVDFVLASTLVTARLEYVLDTAGLQLTKQSASSEDDMQRSAQSYLQHIIRLIAQMHYTPSVEPEIASSAIDLGERMVPRYVFSMASVPDISKFLDFTLASLIASELMPKRSAAHFWAIFVQRYELSEEAARFVDSVMQRYGPQLCQILVQLYAGEASRSELEFLTEPLRKLVIAHSKTRQWLGNALESDEFPSQKVGHTEKRMWLSKIMHLRGAKATNSAVKEFWLACRGNEFSYAS